MSKLYYFIEPTGYNQYVAAAAEGSEHAFVFGGYQSQLEEKLLKWHNAWPFNKHFELPFKGYWFHKYVKAIPEDVNYIVMAESFHLSYSKSFFKHLRKRFPSVKLCFVFSNPVGEYNLEKVRAMQDYYDMIITFAKDDAVKYGYQYCDVLPYRLPDLEKDVELESDIFYVGKEKGRLDQIISLYERAVRLGLKCKFYIVEVPEEKQLYADDIIYNHPIPYNEVLYHVQRTRCILELLQDGCNYISIKTVEALHYRKKLLTNNQSVENIKLYNDLYIRVVKKIDDLDKAFITREIANDIFDTSYLIESFNPLLSYLDDFFRS